MLKTMDSDCKQPILKKGKGDRTAEWPTRFEMTNLPCFKMSPPAVSASLCLVFEQVCCFCMAFAISFSPPLVFECLCLYFQHTYNFSESVEAVSTTAITISTQFFTFSMPVFQLPPTRGQLRFAWDYCLSIMCLQMLILGACARISIACLGTLAFEDSVCFPFQFHLSMISASLWLQCLHTVREHPDTIIAISACLSSVSA